MYDQVVKCQRAGLCLSEHFLISIAVASLGPLNETACQFLKDLGRRISAQSGDERERERLPVPRVICCHSAIQRYLAPQQS